MRVLESVRRVPRTRCALLGAAVLGLALFTPACSPAGTAIDPRFEAAAQSALSQLELDVQRIAHSGERRIRTTRREPGERSWTAEYRESIGVDGRGNYQLECVDVLQSPYADPKQFADRLNRSEGFIHRYRDFHIADADLLLDNYVVLQFGRQLTVAGRDCFTLQLERRDDPQASEPIVGWDLAIDLATGLVLQWQRTVDGNLTDEGVYEWVSYGAPSNLVAHVPSNAEFSFEPKDVRSLFAFDLTTPTLLPDGFQRIDRARVVDAEDTVWLKETFSDGIETAFFLYTVKTSAVLPAAASKTGADLRGSGGTAVGTGGALPTSGPGSPGGEMVSLDGGQVGITQFVEPGRRAIVAGRIGVDDRRWMIESAVF